MLLDSYALKKGLADLPSLKPESGFGGGANFTKRVNQSTAKVDPILKTLQVRSSPAEGLVQAYLIHIRDRSEVKFRKILEIKGIIRKDQAHLVELFNAPSLSSKTGKLLWVGLVPVYWALAFLLAAAIPNFPYLSGLVAAVCILQFSYTFPPLLMLMIIRWLFALMTSTPVIVQFVRTARMTLVCSSSLKLGLPLARGRYVRTGPARRPF